MQETRHAGSIPGSGRSPEEGHNNPFQYSCLENPMDRGFFRATVHRIAQRRTRLKRFSMYVHTIVKSSYHKIPNLFHHLFLLVIQGLCFAKVGLFPGPHLVGKERTTWYLIPRAQTWPQLCAVLRPSIPLKTSSFLSCLCNDGRFFALHTSSDKTLEDAVLGFYDSNRIFTQWVSHCTQGKPLLNPQVCFQISFSIGNDLF